VATEIRVDGQRKEVTDLSLENLQKLVGGYIEIINTNDGRLMVVDEEGLLKDKHVNQAATHLASRMIVGNVVVANVGEIE